MTVPAVSLIVPCCNEQDYIESCIRSLLAQDLPVGSFEIIVADGLSNDGTRNILARLAAEYTCLRLVDNPGRIVSTGLNTAIHAARSKIIVRIDVHTQYAPDYVRQCLAVLQETGTDNVGGPWVAQGTGYMGRAVAAAFQSPFAVGGARGHNPHHIGPVDTVYLGCWPREVFDRIGFFDEELVRNQDDEFNLRLSRAGGLIWQSPRIKSWYHPCASLRSFWCCLQCLPAIISVMATAFSVASGILSSYVVHQWAPCLPSRVRPENYQHKRREVMPALFARVAHVLGEQHR